MTSDGVDGTAADGHPGGHPGARAWDEAPRSPFIKHDDGRLAPRYIGRDYSHTPAGAAPNSLRRERQVASALRNTPDLATLSCFSGADGTAERAGTGVRLWPGAIGIGRAHV